MTDTIQLQRLWTLGTRIGQGGFGRVFEAVDAHGLLAAVKLIPKAPGADRELLFEDLTGIRCVVPIIDSGEWNDSWVVVMPRAEKSLRRLLTEQPILSPADAVAILTNVATALCDLKGKVVHRDIKPENVLLLDGQWCLSDFGIARYAEASTAQETHKWTWTAAYNPPERWRSERAAAASDIYSLGVMAYEMLSGHLPFSGPDFRSQHLTEDPKPLTNVPTLLASLVAECLFKAPEVRPAAPNLLARLALVLRPSSPSIALLQAANQAQVQRIAKEAAVQSAARSAAERRRDIVSAATRALELVAERLYQSLSENASAANLKLSPVGATLGFTVSLGQATLNFSSVNNSQDDSWGAWKPMIEVIAHASISIRIPPDRFGYEGRSHSLWFCDAQQSGVFHWYETAFMDSAFLAERTHHTPFALPPSESAGKALSRAMTATNVAWPFTLIEAGNDDGFQERWMTWFALAAQGNLVHPSTMPERPVQGSWRN